MPKTRAAKDVAPRIRGAFLKALDPNMGGLDIHTLMKQSLQKDFLATLNAVSRFVPKELLLQGDDDNPLEITQVFRIELVDQKGEVVDITPERVERQRPSLVEVELLGDQHD